MPKTIEQIAEENERRIVRFTNIDNESFTHAFRGVKISVQAGQSYVGRFPECEHLATHLARKIIAREKKKGGADKDPRGAVLYIEAEISELKSKILEDMGTETQESFTVEEQRKKDIEQLEKKFAGKPKPAEVSKADVIKSLKERGVEPDVTQSKEELLQKLVEAESKG